MRYLARGSGYALFLTPAEAVLALRPPARPGAAPSARAPGAVLRMRFVGARRDPAVTAERLLPGRSTYLRGAATSGTSVRTFARVRYRGLWPGIDAVFYGIERRLEHDFVVAPGADPSAIGFAFRGARTTRIDGRGDLVLGTSAGVVRQLRPVAYQVVGGRRHAVASSYAARRDGRFGIGSGATTRPAPSSSIRGSSTRRWSAAAARTSAPASPSTRAPTRMSPGSPTRRTSPSPATRGRRAWRPTRS